MERPGREKSVGRSSGSWAGLVSGISNNRLTGVVLIVFPEDPGKLECLAAADREPEPHLLLAHPLPPRPERGVPRGGFGGRDGRRDYGGRDRLGGTRRGGRSGTGAAALRPLPGHRLGTGRGRYRRVRGAPLEDRLGQQERAGRPCGDAVTEYVRLGRGDIRGEGNQDSRDKDECRP